MLEVVDPGFGMALQDRGRPGFAQLGVPPSGALDTWGHACVLILAAAVPDAASLEITLGGAELVAVETCAVALAGADLGAERDDGLALESGRVHRLPATSRIRFTGSPPPGAVGVLLGVRAYLALAGGIAANRVLGSAATLASAGLGGLGGRMARAGDRLMPIRPGDLGAVGHAWPAGTAPHPALSREPVRFVPGPDLGDLASGTVDAFAEQDWTVTHESSRMGVRLDGAPLPPGSEILSHPLLPGAIQVPASGRPIVLLADGPTLGGYPVIGVVARADLPVMAQRRPGERIRFRAVTADEAREAWSAQRRGLDRIATTLTRDALWHRLPGEIRG